MQKVVKFLEAYVQWLALGLGALWLLWVGYAYWATKPVAVEINQVNYGPSEIDDYVAQSGGPIDTLSHSIKGEGKTPPELAKFQQKAPQYAALFHENMDLKSYTPPVLTAMVPTAKSVEGPVANQKIDAMKRASLPVLAVDTIKHAGVTSGLSVVLKPDPKAPLLPTDPTQKTIQDPNVVPPKLIALVPTEVTWVTVLGKVDMTKLTEAFTKADIPAETAFTQYLRLNLIREELMADGTWGNQRVVDDLANQFKPPMPKIPVDEVAYLDWAGTSVGDIIQPPFYETLRGDVWRTASMPVAVDETAALPVEFDPATVKDVSKLTPEQRKLWVEYNQAKKKEDEEKRKSDAELRRNRTPRGGGGEGRVPSGAPRPGDNERIDIGAGRGRGARGAGRALPSEGNIRGPGRTATEGRPTASNPNLPQPGGELPAGAFSPEAATVKDVEVWAHDDSTLPGHTYRYKFQLVLKNPLFATQGIAGKPADEEKLSIGIATAEWSDKVLSPKKQYFFAATGGDTINSNNPKMRFEYFYWEDGEWKTKNLDLHPGDAVGATPWTLVDFRPATSGNENRALLVNDLGELENRFYKTDIASPDYKRLHGLSQPPAAAATAQ
jgi:hypothetical protein